MLALTSWPFSHSHGCTAIHVANSRLQFLCPSTASQAGHFSSLLASRLLDVLTHLDPRAHSLQGWGLGFEGFYKLPGDSNL